MLCLGGAVCCCSGCRARRVITVVSYKNRMATAQICKASGCWKCAIKWFERIKTDPSRERKRTLWLTVDRLPSSHTMALSD